MKPQNKYIIIGTIIALVLTYVAIAFADSFDNRSTIKTSGDVIYYDLNNHKYTQINVVYLQDDEGNVIIVDSKDLSKNYYRAGS